MKDLLSLIINLRALDMSNINSKGNSLVLYGKKNSYNPHTQKVDYNCHV